MFWSHPMHGPVGSDAIQIRAFIRVDLVHRYQAMNRVYWCVAASMDFATTVMALTPEGEP